jgi:pyrroline-5-carboxylate reductase
MNIVFLGGGRMGGAMIGGLLRPGRRAAATVTVCEADPERRAALRERHGIRVEAQPGPLLETANVVVLAVKPQQLDELLRSVAPLVGSEHLVLSIAAGRRIAHIESLLPAGRVARVMPNLPALVEEGMSAYCLGTRCRAGDRAEVERIVTSFGKAIELPEEQFDTVTALSGSGPAFFAAFLQDLIEAAARNGMAPAAARALTVQTMLGTARLLAAGTMTPEELVRAVSSPGGTTLAGLAVLEQAGLGEVVARAVEAAARRSRELSG